MPSAAFRGCLLLGLLGLVFALVILFLPSSVIADEPPARPTAVGAAPLASAPQYPVSGRILTRLGDDGRLELCFESEREEVLCPRLRFLDPGRVRRDRWITSSEFRWDVPIDPDLVLSAVPPESFAEPVGAGASCTPDFERMMTATWKVETLRGRGSAFHIGNGRFLTAHHVIDSVPPFVTLTHEELAMPAAVLGSDSTVDLALLEVYDQSLTARLPAVNLRVPTQADLGEEVFLVGYPFGNALNVSFGGLISRVWGDEILTTAPAIGGNSGGPIFDACGEVLGVLWAGSARGSFSHSGQVLIDALADIKPKWPPLPENLPYGLDQLPDVLIWHFSTEPPPDHGCAGFDADLWVGIAGGRDTDFGIKLNGWLSNDCSRGRTRVIAFEGGSYGLDRTFGDACVFHFDPSDRAHHDIDPGRTEIVLHESDEPYGRARLVRLFRDGYCPGEFTHELVVDLDPPLDSGYNFESALHRPDGIRHVSLSKGYGTYGVTDEPRSPHARYRQRFRVPANAELVRFHLSHRDQTWMTDIQAPDSDAAKLPLTAEIAVLVEGDTGDVQLCLQLDSDRRLCAAEPLALGSLDEDVWRELPAMRWLQEVPAEQLDGEQDLAVRYSCALNPTIGDQGWQLTTLTGINVAIYVGNAQFLASASLFSSELPWGVLSQRNVALPAVVVARDERNNLVLLEILGQVEEEDLGTPVRLAQITDEDEGRYVMMLRYPWGDADRFRVAPGRATGVSGRSFSFSTSSSDPLFVWTGTPVIDGCTHDVVGMMLGGGVLSAGPMVQSLQKLRSLRQMPELPTSGPILQGSSALWPLPLYVGTEQPDFGGWICNVRESERYGVYYAIYLARSDDFEIRQVVDGEQVRVRGCGWRDKIFIVEYRSDRVPELICAAPNRPDHPLSDISVEFSAPDGVELIQIAELKREPCGDIEYDDAWGDRWSTDLFLSIRVTTDVDFDDIQVDYFDSEGRELDTHSRRGGDVDPDVLSWLVNVIEERNVSKIAVRVSDRSQ